MMTIAATPGRGAIAGRTCRRGEAVATRGHAGAGPAPRPSLGSPAGSSPSPVLILSGRRSRPRRCRRRRRLAAASADVSVVESTPCARSVARRTTLPSACARQSPQLPVRWPRGLLAVYDDVEFRAALRRASWQSSTVEGAVPTGGALGLLRICLSSRGRRKMNHNQSFTRACDA